jgi:protein-S-isoprenylcysteine O-methyltransferase Ste14
MLARIISRDKEEKRICDPKNVDAGAAMNLSVVWQVLYWGWVLSEIYISLVVRTKRGSGNIRDRGSQLILWTVIVAALTVCGWSKSVFHPNIFGGAAWVKLAAIILLIAGLIVRWTAILTLGRAFSANVAIGDSQKICRAGMYRVLRHPSYLGMLLIFLAAGLHSHNWVGLAVAVVPTTAAVLYRIHVEELALRDAFGEEYIAYSSETKRLVPGVY